MAGSPSLDDRLHRPGVISAFFVVKAGVFAVGFWTWLTVLVIRGLPVSGWYFLSATGAITTTLVAVILGARYALDRAAADRHQVAMRAVVELSWETFSAALGTTPERQPPAGPPTARTGGDLIHLPQDSRPRQRR